MPINWDLYKTNNEVLGSGSYGSILASNDNIHVVKIIESFSSGINEVVAQTMVIGLSNVMQMVEFRMVQKGRFFIIYKKMKGDLRKFKFENQQDLFQMLTSIAIGLTGIHSRNMIHNDIKPENILYDDTGYYITDFGIARQNICVKNYNNVGMSGPYRSPETILRLTTSFPGDVWSFGILMLKFLLDNQGINIYDYYEYDDRGNYDIQKIFGKPTEVYWPGVTNSKYYNKYFSMNYVSHPLIHEILGQLNVLPSIIQLLKDILILNPNRRPTIYEVLIRLNGMNVQPLSCLNIIKKYADEVVNENSWLLQTNIPIKMRQTVYEWLLKTADVYDIGRNTHALACTILDRYLINKRLTENDVTFYAFSSLFIADKISETFPTNIQDFEGVLKGDLWYVIGNIVNNTSTLYRFTLFDIVMGMLKLKDVEIKIINLAERLTSAAIIIFDVYFKYSSEVLAEAIVNISKATKDQNIILQSIEKEILSKILLNFPKYTITHNDVTQLNNINNF